MEHYHYENGVGPHADRDEGTLIPKPLLDDLGHSPRGP
jgi:hypothetical protein